MVRETDHIRKAGRALDRARPRARTTMVACVACGALVAALALSGCGATQSAIPAETTATTGAHMAGPAVEVNITPEVLAAKPKPWVLTSPESAVRSFLDWTSYAYRTAQSSVARPTMTNYEEVRVDSAVQYNIEKSRLIDQTLTSIVFGKASVEGTRAIVTAKEEWTYNYVSIATAGQVIGGPYPASYDTTYTVVKAKNGDWVVDSVEAAAIGPVN
jgi:hypothetical protein